MRLLLALLLVAAAGAAIIQPRPVDNRRDPHDGEPFEWQPVDDDPWPGPSFSFAELPGLAGLDAAAARPASSVGEARARADILMQVLRAVFNSNNGNGNGGAVGKPVSSNEVVPRPAAPAPPRPARSQQPRQDKQRSAVRTPTV